MEYKLSPSSLNLLQDCPRCFWLHFNKKIKRPSGPMSSIPIKMDSGIILWGRPDEYFELEDGSTIPFDHKTKSKDFPIDFSR